MCCIGEWGCTDFWKKEKEKIYMEKTVRKYGKESVKVKSRSVPSISL